NNDNTINAQIGGKLYSAQLPHDSSYSISISNTDYNGQRTEQVKITIDGDVTVYRTVNGKTTVTDGFGNIRTDGGPFHINSNV
ncbi:hypothetical protein Angca_002036, partial [Angiostrongylus cantonensis]